MLITRRHHFYKIFKVKTKFTISKKEGMHRKDAQNFQIQQNKKQNKGTSKILKENFGHKR